MTLCSTNYRIPSLFWLHHFPNSTSRAVSGSPEYRRETPLLDVMIIEPWDKDIKVATDPLLPSPLIINNIKASLFPPTTKTSTLVQYNNNPLRLETPLHQNATQEPLPRCLCRCHRLGSSHCPG